jgi:glutaconyl-CoA/methylmalonyl-CoA decarboxylase subunit gamma
MKYTVSVNGKSFSVEIEDINARPVVAVVDGERFEITPENGNAAVGVVRTAQAEVKAAPTVNVPAPAQVPSSGNSLTAPLPGTVVELFVHPGDVIEMGQVVVVIEAMKMKNSIRATRGGTVAQVLVSAGQTVAHKQVMVEFR